MIIGRSDEYSRLIICAGNQCLGKLCIDYRGLRDDVLFTLDLIYPGLCANPPVGSDATCMFIGSHIITKGESCPIWCHIVGVAHIGGAHLTPRDIAYSQGILTRITDFTD